MGLTLIKALTASSSASLTFADGTDDVVMDNTYFEYQFFCVGIHPATDAAQLVWQANAVGGADFNETIQSSAVRAYNQEDGSDAGVGYRTGEDQDLGTDYDIIMEGIDNANDMSGSGQLIIYDPSNTTYAKLFQVLSNTTLTAGTKQQFQEGYIDTTAAIDEVQFKMTSGNIDAGTIYMYGVS